MRRHPEHPDDLIHAGSAPLHLPEPRHSPKAAEQPPAMEETTVELPRYVEPEQPEPALSMLTRGRHGM